MNWFRKHSEQWRMTKGQGPTAVRKLFLNKTSKTLSLFWKSWKAIFQRAPSSLNHVGLSGTLCLIFLCTAANDNLKCTNAHKLWQPHSTLEWGRKPSLRCCILCNSAAVLNVCYRSSVLPKLLPGSQPVSWFKLCTMWDWEGVRLYSGCL